MFDTFKASRSVPSFGLLSWHKHVVYPNGHQNASSSFCLSTCLCSETTLKAACLSLSLTGWNELLIASFSHRSISVKDGILLATGLHVHRNSAHSAGVGAIFDRWVFEPSHIFGVETLKCESVKYMENVEVSRLLGITNVQLCGKSETGLLGQIIGQHCTLRGFCHINEVFAGFVILNCSW